MTLPRLIRKSMAYSSCLSLARSGCARPWSSLPGIGSRPWSSLSGSRFSSPVDDKENASVISDLLVYERRRQLKKSLKTRENGGDSEVKKTVVKRKVPETERQSNSSNRDDNSQAEIMNLMKVVKQKKCCYIIHQDAAETLVRHVKKDLREGDVIVEANLGAGILTSALLDQTHHKIIGYEPNMDFMSYLRSQHYHHASRLELHCLDLFRFYWYYAISKREPEREADPNRLAQLLNPLPIREGKEESPVKIVSSVCDTAFFHNLALSFTFQCCFYKNIFPVFYVFIPEGLYGHLTSYSRNIISRRLSFPLLYYFDLEHLDTAPKSNFYSPYFRKLKLKKNSVETFHLVKITPKPNVHEIVPKQELGNFHYFMRCLNNTKSGESLIFQMEKWIPGCGIDYIKNGFRMFTHPRQLSKEQLLEAYRLFISLPSFKECMFHHLCENWTIQFGLKDEVSYNMEAGSIDREVEIDDDVADIDDGEFTAIKSHRS